MSQILKEVQSLSVEVGFIKENVGSLQEEVGSIKENVGSLQEEVGSIKENVGSLQEEVGSIKKDVGSLQEEVTSMKEENENRFNQLEQSVREVNDTARNIERKQENQEEVIDLLSRRSIDLEVGLKKVR